MAVLHCFPVTARRPPGDNSKSTEAVIGFGGSKLADARQAERNGDNTPRASSAQVAPNITRT